ncbi:helix-turn-helix transcriptional regulator [Ruegeria arenilitoris]|uniref:helix-turn-helix transcriptional regulator n=1 Tax=Ruegeria arenilitoris TaxID=1173585 RepID=UPI00147CE5ED|nr:helix-turn-helix transcriptional regulator [Ruegeria arenilitoris]
MSISFSKSAQAQNSFNFVMEWTHALTSKNSIPQVLYRLIKLVNADAALIARTLKVERKVKYIARCCSEEGKVWPSQPQTLVERVLGESFLTARVGSIWTLSDALVAGNTETLRHFEGNLKALGEVIVVPLDTTGGHVDHIELHFRHEPAQFELDLLAMLAPTLASGWCKRTPGSISSYLEKGRNHNLKEVSDTEHVPILGPQNPAGLSRCEFRVCAMLKEGMTVKKVSEALTVCPTTVRSHLSSVFSKTGASNQVELLHLLNRKIQAGRRSRDAETANFG